MKGDRPCSGEFVWFNLNCISWIIHINGAVGDESLWFALYLISLVFWMVSFHRLRIRNLFCGWSSPQSQPVLTILWSLDPRPVLHLLITIKNYNPTLRPRIVSSQSCLQPFLFSSCHHSTSVISDLFHLSYFLRLQSQKLFLYFLREQRWSPRWPHNKLAPSKPSTKRFYSCPLSSASPTPGGRARTGLICSWERTRQLAACPALICYLWSGVLVPYAQNFIAKAEWKTKWYPK